MRKQSEKKIEGYPTRGRFVSINVSPELNLEFRKICIVQELKPSEQIKKLIANWIAQQKKIHKIVLPIIKTPA